jgi:hypothetical protein
MRAIMKLTFTQPQANALFDLFQDQILPDNPFDLDEKLLQILMIKVFKKLRAKLEGKPGQGYSVSLSDEETIAFYLYFNGRDYGQNYIYEQSFIRKQIQQIDKQYK